MTDFYPGLIEWTSAEGHTFQLRVTSYYDNWDECNFDLLELSTTHSPPLVGDRCFSNITREAAAQVIAALVDRFDFDPMVKAALP